MTAVSDLRALAELILATEDDPWTADELRLARGYLALLDRLARLQAVVDAARDWWLMRRPIGWTEAEHLVNPTVNCRESRSSFELATVVASMVAALGEQQETR